MKPMTKSGQPLGIHVGPSPEAGTTAICFGRFRILPGARELYVDERPVELGSRAFDLLLALLATPGVVVSKSDLFARAWPNTAVDDSNLRSQIVAIRRALGSDRNLIKTVPGRGYLFVAGPAVPGSLSRLESLEENLEDISQSGDDGIDIDSRGASSRTIAVLDDDHNVREGLRGLLHSAGLQVELFSSVKEFVARVLATPPQCLILDVFLPNVSGLEVYAMLRKENVKTPVIFISGHADVPMSVRAMKDGAIEFLTKPVRHQELLDAVRVALQVSISHGRSG